MRLLKIGRDASCDIVLHSEKVSSLHAELTLMNSGDIMLEDKGSRNGTFIQNQAIKAGKPVSIRRGDAIRFGDVELQWSQVPMPEDNSAYRAIYGIGSHFNNDIQVSGGTVSRYHATIKVGRDNKVYIVDHSKNGTTVDGQRITSNTPYRIKKTSTIVCGGVPVNLKTAPIQWPSEAWKTILAVAAGVLLLCGIGFGIFKMVKGMNRTMTDTELYARYNRSIVMVLGIYHYEVSVGDLPMKNLKGLIPEKVFYVPGIGMDKPIDVSSLTQREYIESLNEMTKNQGMLTGTAFFVSNDGKLLTNLHVVKPWIFNSAEEAIKNYYAQLLAKVIAKQDVINMFSGVNATGLTAYISQVKVTGVLDNIALVPQGETFDPDNFIKCRVLSAGSDKAKDIALIQTVSKRLPTGDCTFVNVTDSMDVTDEALSVGNHVYTLGFPSGTNNLLQKEGYHTGIQVIAQGGTIIQQNSEFDFGYNAPTTGGASGSPVFNDQGKLIGIHHQGFSQVETQGYNYGVKAKYIKELLESPYTH